jgi:predicted DNA-binding transcriptional regulator AlpA
MTAKQSPAHLFDDDRLYSAQEIREKVGGKTHIITIWRWAKKGRLGKPRKIGPNTTRFLGRELNQTLLEKIDG